MTEAKLTPINNGMNTLVHMFSFESSSFSCEIATDKKSYASGCRQFLAKTFVPDICY